MGLLEAWWNALTDRFARRGRPELAPPIAELTLEFSHPELCTTDGEQRAGSTLQLRYSPANESRSIDGTPTEFVSPIGVMEAEELRWYIEDYCRWPFGVFRDRAKVVETKLPIWGRMLYEAIVGKQDRVMRAFLKARGSWEKRITVCVDDRDATADGKVAAALLFGLPWELLHDGHSYLFEGAIKARVRRALSSSVVWEPLKPRERVRVLLVRARPEDPRTAFIDPRSSAKPLLESLRGLGDQVKLDILPDGTFEAFRQALTDADNNHEPYHVIHFDGHGAYDAARASGFLYFESGDDVYDGLDQRRAHAVSAKKIGKLLRQRRVPLLVLEACQTAMAMRDVGGSIAAELLRQGGSSIVAMRYSVLIEMTKMFVSAFYESLAKGHRIGRAMVEAQLALQTNTGRLDFGPKGYASLQDWMVPLLFQNGEDPPIFTPRTEKQIIVQETHQGGLPKAAAHGFVGRARELLQIERRLARDRRVAIIGSGGAGKTALAVEAAEWSLLSQQRERAAFVSVERVSDSRTVLDAIGRQLVPGYSVALAEAVAEGKATLDVKSALLQSRTLLVVDNLESLLVLAGNAPANANAVQEIFDLVRELADVGETWLITTSREALPVPFVGAELRIGSLDRNDGRKLLMAVLLANGLEPVQEGKAYEELTKLLDGLIEVVRGHARSLVLLGPTLVERGIEATHEAVRREMAALEKRHPGERELSLLASVRLSLERLDEATRRRIAPLCVFQRVAIIGAMARVLQVDTDEVQELGNKLVALGLAEWDRPYLLMDPALSELLASEMDPSARTAVDKRWRQTMAQFAGFLYEQRFRDASITSKIAPTVMIELLEALEATARAVQSGLDSVDVAISYAACLEGVVSMYGQPWAFVRVCAVSETLTKLLPTWNNAPFDAERLNIMRLAESGELQSALHLAIQLRDQVEAAGDANSAGHDRAGAWWLLGETLRLAGHHAQALDVIEVACNRYALLEGAGDERAASMVSSALAIQGDCLFDMERFDAAGAKFEEAIRRYEAHGEVLLAAKVLEKLAGVRFSQGRLADALDACHVVRQHYDEFGYVSGVAKVWHHIGTIHLETNDLQAAERAYLEALRLYVSCGDRAAEIVILSDLGAVYAKQQRWADAVAFGKQAVALWRSSEPRLNLGSNQIKLGKMLYQLRCLNEAREVLKAVITTQAGNTSAPWQAWHVLYDVERAAGRPKATVRARKRVMKAYRAYRLTGGEPSDHVLQHIGFMAKWLNWEQAQIQFAFTQDNADKFRAFIYTLDEIRDGNRSLALLQDPALDPLLAVEIQIFIKAVSS